LVSVTAYSWVMAKAARDLHKAQHEDGFAARLRELRRARDLSQSDLGELVGIHYTHVSRYERGISRPAADTLMRLADALGVSSDYLIEGAADDAAQARLSDAGLLRAFQDAEKLPAEDKAVIKALLDAFVTKRQLQELIAR
jgi:transcriptional regulator with XRE-family HTH domain